MVTGYDENQVQVSYGTTDEIEVGANGDQTRYDDTAQGPPAGKQVPVVRHGPWHKRAPH